MTQRQYRQNSGTNSASGQSGLTFLTLNVRPFRLTLALIVKKISWHHIASQASSSFNFHISL
jgi:hypothetical protein